MTFVKTDCPECGERILLDVANGYGYCMYCGAQVAPEGLALLPSPLRVSLRRELEADDPYDGRPWYPKVREAGSALRSGDPDAAASVLREAYSLAGSDDEKADVTDAADSEIIETIVSVIDAQDPAPYRGGMRAVFEVCEQESGMGLTTQFMDMCLLQFSLESDHAKDPGRVDSMLVSIAYLVRDYLSMIRRPEEARSVLAAATNIMDDLVAASGMEDPVSSDREISLKDVGEGMRYRIFIAHMAVTFLVEIEDMSQKELVRQNRIVASRDPAKAMADLDEAYSRVMDEDPEAYYEPLVGYFDYMLSPDQPVRRPGKRRRSPSWAPQGPPSPSVTA